MTTSATTTSPSRPVRSEDILPYLDYIASTATRLARSPRARRAGAEFDDLFQEGMLAVIVSLPKGIDPMLVIANRMKDWIRYQRRQRSGDPVPYGAMLPTESPLERLGGEE